MKSPRLFILFGAPGSGKSETCNALRRITDESTVIIQKETTRPGRKTDSHEIKSVDFISDKCDFRYSQYHHEYGFSSDEIWNAFKRKKNAVVIVNDIRTIKQLKRRFGALARAVYIHSTIKKVGLWELARKRNPELSDEELTSDIERRIEKIKTVHRKYIENTHLFDETVLNAYEDANEDSLSKLDKQLTSIITNQKYFGEPLPSTARIFIIVGASFSGKDELVNAMQTMDPIRVDYYKKQTNRPKRTSDNNELRHVKKVTADFNITYTKNGFTYGISTKELWDLLSKGKVLLVVLSDEKCIETFRVMFGGTCAVLFLHADFDYKEIHDLMSAENLDSEERDKRLKGIDDAKQLYIDRTDLFDHVLLNTSEPEDLYDQAFNILDYYCG